MRLPGFVASMRKQLRDRDMVPHGSQDAEFAGARGRVAQKYAKHHGLRLTGHGYQRVRIGLSAGQCRDRNDVARDAGAPQPVRDTASARP
jgi:hypothetical protein